MTHTLALHKTGSEHPITLARRTATVAAAFVRAYQVCLSGLKPACCRFQPSCSEYARQAILTRGLLGGSRLALLRLLRCQPFYRGPVYDPVPVLHPPAPVSHRKPGKPTLS